MTAGEHDLRGRQRRRRDGELPAAQASRVSRPSSIRGSSSCTRTTTGIPSQLQPGRCPRRRRRQLGRRHRDWRSRRRIRRCSPARRRPHPVPHRAVLRPARARQRRAVRRPSRADACARRSAARSARGSSRTAAPLIRVKPKDLERGRHRHGSAGSSEYATAFRSPRTVESLDGRQRHLVHRISTGLLVDRPADPRRPAGAEHERGIVRQEPGLYFVGLDFLYAATSDTITGVQRDARRIVKHLMSRTRTPRAVGSPVDDSALETAPVRSLPSPP